MSVSFLGSFSFSGSETESTTNAGVGDTSLPNSLGYSLQAAQDLFSQRYLAVTNGTPVTLDLAALDDNLRAQTKDLVTGQRVVGYLLKNIGLNWAQARFLAAADAEISGGVHNLPPTTGTAGGLTTGQEIFVQSPLKLELTCTTASQATDIEVFVVTESTA